MYSERDRIRFVEMMWAEGLTVMEAHRRFGVSRSALTRWRDQALSGELDAAMPPIRGRAEHRKHGRYPQETVDEAVRLYRMGEKPQHIARRLGIADSNLPRTWSKKREARAMMEASGKTPTEEAAMAKKKEGPPPDVARLEEEIDEARFELRVYKEIITNPKASSPENLSKRQLSELAERLRRGSGYSLQRILTYLGISKSTFHYHRSRMGSDPAASQSSFDAHVRRAFEAGRSAYGYRRVAAALESGGIRAPERKVRESMRRQGLTARCARSEKRWSSYAGEIGDAPPNLLLDGRKRHIFRADAPNRIWVTDITELQGRDGKCYSSVIVDCYDGKVVAHRTSTSPNAELANSTLLDAVAQLGCGEHPIIHSDRGGHYRWRGWVAICEENGLVRSMSRKAHSPDNAACEGFFGRAKTECLFPLMRAGADVGELMEAVDGYVSWYNQGRLKAFEVDGRIVYEPIEAHRSRKEWAA